MIPKAPIFILIFSLLSASVIGIDASVSMFVFLIVTYKPVFFVVNFVVSRIISSMVNHNTYKPRRPTITTKEFIRMIDESGDHHE